MAHSESLREFRASDTREVARWPSSLDEVRRWAEREEFNRGQPVDYVWMHYPLG